jgi:hypothetical protein
LRSQAIKAELFAQLRQPRGLPFIDTNRIALEGSDEGLERIGRNTRLDSMRISHEFLIRDEPPAFRQESLDRDAMGNVWVDEVDEVRSSAVPHAGPEFLSLSFWIEWTI